MAYSFETINNDVGKLKDSLNTLKSSLGDSILVNDAVKWDNITKEIDDLILKLDGLPSFFETCATIINDNVDILTK